MHSLQLKAALEERLAFYSRLMEKLSKAIEQEDAERIEYYQGLEQETLKSLTNLERCISALSRATGPFPEATAGQPSEDELLLESRVQKARERALEATRGNCVLLRRQLDDLKLRISQVRSKNTPLSFKDTTPSFIDLDI
jgi:hypothetical protein